MVGAIHELPLPLFLGVSSILADKIILFLNAVNSIEQTPTVGDGTSAGMVLPPNPPYKGGLFLPPPLYKGRAGVG
jgi:hypothetical protein